MTPDKSLGKMGEDAAKRYLEGAGYEIIATNYRDRRGEIDLIGIDGEVLAFIEVKTRRSTKYGTPGEAVDTEKQRRITRTAAAYMAKNSTIYQRIRFDVVEIMVLGREISQIRLLKNAFEATDRL